MSAHLYIHYPYCLYKCHYCDFNSYATEVAAIPQNRYTETLLNEIERRRINGRFFSAGEEVATVFFGGGTPSLMNPGDVERVLKDIFRSHTPSSDLEITLESNPGTVTAEKFREFKLAGINRVSIGVQSFNNKYLGRFGRIHTGVEALNAITAALNAGFERVSCDLIFGFPGQTLDEWREDLTCALSLGLRHVSCYALTAEEGTSYGKEVRQGHLSETDPDLFADMQELTYKMTDAAGLPAYEISNFAKPGEESRHNLAYWHTRSYVGLGAGAVSQFIGEEGSAVRQTNHKIPDHYMRMMREEGVFCVDESVSRKDAMKEFLMMGLRLKDGILVADFEKRFGVALIGLCEPVIAKHVALGSLILDGGRLKPTHKGFMQNNAVVGDLFSVLE